MDVRALERKVCLITGSTGIGAAAARLASQAGASVFLAALDPDATAALAAELRDAGGSCDFRAADLTWPDAAAEAVRQCIHSFHRLDCVFNVAGASGRRYGDGPVHACTSEGWDKTIEINLRSMFLMCREALRHMMTQPIGASGARGSIVNMTSISAMSPEPRHFATHAYAASKAAVIGLTRSMASYYAPFKIRVNAIAPGLVRTPMSLRAQRDAEILALMQTKQPLVEDLIEAADVARAALFLLGDDSRAITGEVMAVDAGWSIAG